MICTDCGEYPPQGFKGFKFFRRGRIHVCNLCWGKVVRIALLGALLGALLWAWPAWAQQCDPVTLTSGERAEIRVLVTNVCTRECSRVLAEQPSVYCPPRYCHLGQDGVEVCRKCTRIRPHAQ